MMGSNTDKYDAAVRELNERRDAAGLMLNGKLYSQVKDRVDIFRRNFGYAYGIDTSVDYSRGFNKGAMIVASAKITDLASGYVVASGHSMEWIGNGDIGITAPIEACETSAIGRALAAFGLHGGEYASANEMEAIPHKKQAGIEATGMKNGEQHFNNGPAPLPTPPSMPDGYYVPDEHGAMWDNPGEIFQGIIDTLKSIDSIDLLGKYWSSLDMVKRRWEKENPEWWSELKDNFVQRTSEIKGN